MKNSNNLYYAILNQKSNEHVGNINAYIDERNKIADIGVLIGKNGCGYGYMAWKEMIKILFTENNEKSKHSNNYILYLDK